MADTDRDADGVYTGPDEATFTLTKAIERKGADALTQISVREPTAKELSRFFEKINTSQDNGVEALIHLIANTSGIPHIDVEKIRQRDLDDIGMFFQGFTRVPPKTPSAP